MTFLQSSFRRSLLAAPILVATLLPAAAAAATPPAYNLSGEPMLYAAADSSRPGAPTAWVVFRTNSDINPRLTVVRAGDRSGRSYRASGAATCVRSTIVGGRPLRAGVSYTVQFFARTGVGSTSTRSLQTERTLIARQWSKSPTRPPTCRTQRPSPFTATAAFRFGVRAFARQNKATVPSASITCRSSADVGDTGRCSGFFQLRRGGRIATYRLTSKAATFRNTPSSIEYRVYATARGRVDGLPRRVSLLGFASRDDL